MFGCQPGAPPFWLAAAAIVLTFSFFGFLFSRLPFCAPLAMPLSSWWMVNRFPCFWSRVVATMASATLFHRLHGFIMCRTSDRFVDFAGQLILADPMKAYCQLRGLLCIHR